MTASSPAHLDLDELPASVGRSFGPTAWLTVGQGRIDSFAEATGDRQWIHVDPVRAAQSPFGTTIAHGHLTTSLCAYFMPQLYVVDGTTMAINYGSDRVRLPSPVLSGSNLRATARILAVDPISGGFQLRLEATLQAEGGIKPACVAELLTRYLR